MDATVSEIASTGSDLAVSLAGVSKFYGERIALNGISIEVPRGSVFALVGPNGAGKTTLCKIVVGLTTPDDGEVVVLGHRLPPGLTAAVARTGVVLETMGFYPHLGIRANLLLLSRPCGLGPDRVDAAMDMVGLGGEAGTRVSALSHGMRQRVTLAAGLVNDPDLLILDEPFTGLDPMMARELVGLIATTAESGTTVLLATHRLGEVARVCTHAAAMALGTVLDTLALDDLPDETDALESWFFEVQRR